MAAVPRLPHALRDTTEACPAAAAQADPEVYYRRRRRANSESDNTPVPPARRPAGAAADRRGAAGTPPVCRRFRPGPAALSEPDILLARVPDGVR